MYVDVFVISSWSYRCDIKFLQVHPKSIAYKSGVRVGDGIIYICNTPAQYLHHQQAKMEIIRAGNELDLVVQRYIENHEYHNELMFYNSSAIVRGPSVFDHVRIVILGLRARHQLEAYHANLSRVPCLRFSTLNL